MTLRYWQDLTTVDFEGLDPGLGAARHTLPEDGQPVRPPFAQRV